MPAVPAPRRPIWGDEKSDPEVFERSYHFGRSAPPRAPVSAASGIAQSASPFTQEPPQQNSAVPDLRQAEPFSPVGSTPNVSALEDFVRIFGRAAGLPENALAGCDAGQLAEEIGTLLRVITEQCMQLLQDRQLAKRMAHTSNHTTIQTLANNPLKFAPTSEEALRLMFGKPNRSYLEASSAFKQTFDDLKSHQVQTYSAMQHALNDVLAEFDPAEIENSADAGSAFVDLFRSRKAQFWDEYLLRWKVRNQGRQDGLLSAFMSHFAQHYDHNAE